MYCSTSIKSTVFTLPIGILNYFFNTFDRNSVIFGTANSHMKKQQEILKRKHNPFEITGTTEEKSDIQNFKMSAISNQFNYLPCHVKTLSLIFFLFSRMVLTVIITAQKIMRLSIIAEYNLEIKMTKFNVRVKFLFPYIYFWK